jgi:hypothetical protein
MLPSHRDDGGTAAIFKELEGTTGLRSHAGTAGSAQPATVGRRHPARHRGWAFRGDVKASRRGRSASPRCAASAHAGVDTSTRRASPAAQRRPTGATGSGAESAGVAWHDYEPGARRRDVGRPSETVQLVRAVAREWYGEAISSLVRGAWWFPCDENERRKRPPWRSRSRRGLAAQSLQGDSPMVRQPRSERSGALRPTPRRCTDRDLAGPRWTHGGTLGCRAEARPTGFDEPRLPQIWRPGIAPVHVRSDAPSPALIDTSTASPSAPR